MENTPDNEAGLLVEVTLVGPPANVTVLHGLFEERPTCSVTPVAAVPSAYENPLFAPVVVVLILFQDVSVNEPSAACSGLFDKSAPVAIAVPKSNIKTEAERPDETAQAARAAKPVREKIRRNKVWVFMGKRIGVRVENLARRPCPTTDKRHFAPSAFR